MEPTSRWPFLPGKISELLDTDTLAVIEAGCCERLGQAMTILDRGANEGFEARREEIINKRQHFTDFCRTMRNPELVEGGYVACRRCDLANAADFVQDHARSGREYAEFRCHMGLRVGARAVTVRDQVIAIMLGGQFAPDEGIDEILANVAAIADGARSELKLRDPSVRHTLEEMARALQPAPPDFQAALAREAQHVERLVNTEHGMRRSTGEHEFLERLHTAQNFLDIDSLAKVTASVNNLLREVRTFCQADYLVFFASVKENDTVLVPIGQDGLDVDAPGDLAHFNWRKAGLSLQNGVHVDRTRAEIAKILQRGIRGQGHAPLENAVHFVPTVLGGMYRGILLFGPFSPQVDLEREKAFLTEVGRTVGWYTLTEIQVLNLREQQQRWESTARLLTHQIRTALTPINTYIGTAKFLVEKAPGERNNKMLIDSIRVAGDLSHQLGRGAAETVRAHVVLLEPEDLKLERFPLSVLVANCAQGYDEAARTRNRTMIVDESIEALPQAEVDIARLTIALGNIIENALKYSFPGTKIVIRVGTSHQQLDLNNAIVEVQDHGDEIPEDKRKAIFDQGVRVLAAEKRLRIPGSGLGLWEARTVVEAHGGKIDVRCEPTSAHFRQGRAYVVTFQIKIPLSVDA